MRLAPGSLALILVFWGILLGARLGGAEERPFVLLVVVDGLDARVVSPQLTPTLWELARGGESRGVFYPNARAVMPSVTNVNHASLVTGAFPEAHGIVGNRDWQRGTARRRRRLERAELIETDTIFSALAAAGRRAAGVFGKWKLVELFRGDRRLRFWGDLEGDLEPPHPRAAGGSDERTALSVRRTIAELDPEFLFVNLGDLDRTAHRYGPDSLPARKALLEADRQLRRIVDDLKDAGRWHRSIVVVTADHGFSDVSPSSERPYPTTSFGREIRRAGIDDAFAVSNGRVASVYLTDHAPPAELAAEQRLRLKRLRELALAQPEIAEALYRLPNPADGGDAHTIRGRHPDWKLDHPRAGELLLVARAGHQFSDPWSPSGASHRGTHGGPEDRAVPLLWVGGWPGLRAARIEEGATPQAADVGMTIRRLLGLPNPKLRASGAEVRAESRGVVLAAIVD